MHRAWSAFVSLMLLGSVQVTAQPQAPPQKPPPPIESGGSSIAGRVIDRATERPIESVLMTLTSVDRRRTLVTQTDAAGRYAFTSVAAGEYRVIASHADYVTTEFGVKDGRSAVVPIVGVVHVSRDAAKSGIDFSLVLAASAGGIVTRGDGRPLKDATVSAVPPLDRDEEGIFSRPPSARAVTDAQGAYVLHGLPAGLYHITALWNGESGTTGLRANPSVVHYPGTVRSEERVAVSLRSGTTVKGINIVFPDSEVLHISGTVLHSGGGVLDGFLTSADGAQPLNVAADGSFATSRLRAGQYTLVVRARSADSLEAAALSVELFTSELNNVVLGLMPTGTISGRVMTDDGTPVPDEMQVAAVFVSPDGKELEEYGGARGRDRAEIGAGGAFEIRGVFGDRVIRMVGITAGWKIARVMIGKTELTRLSIQPGAAIEDVVVVLSRS
jgi:hypothetical protein